MNHSPSDDADMRQFGYAQQLRRSLGSFSSFAVALSLISVFTGISANFGHGIRQVGGSLVWSWLIVVAGQMLVALLLAELSTRIPLSGYGYQWTSRLLFALARDRMLPGSRWLAVVEEGRRTPRNAIVFISAVSSAVVIGLPALEVITQISAVAGYLGYAGTVIAALRAPTAPIGDGFRLGRARRLIGVAALLWVLGVVAALTIPRTPLQGIETQHLPALSTSGGVGLGLLLYLALIRPRLRRGEAGPPGISGPASPSPNPPTL